MATRSVPWCGRARTPRRLEAAGVEVARGDVTDEGAVIAAARGCEVVHHLAVPTRHARPRILEAVNVAGAGHVIRAAGRTGARVVHCSTTGVYGPLDHLPADEEHPTRPARAYPASKLGGRRSSAASRASRGRPWSSPASPRSTARVADAA